MLVVHICTSLEGGAGLCARRIIEAERKAGIDARALVKYGVLPDYAESVPNDIQREKNPLLRRAKGFLYRRGLWPKCSRYSKIIQRELTLINETICFTSPRTLYKGLVIHPWLAEADVIHLHWLGDFLDYESFFRKVRKPIVWTIHDEYPGLGGFHYAMWKVHATMNLLKIDEEFTAIKEKAYKEVKSLNLVAISTSMQKFFQENELLCHFPTTKIHNGIDPQAFYPIPKSIARHALGIEDDTTVFLFAAFSISEDRKGLKELIEALEQVEIDKKLLICLGNYRKKPNASFEIRCEGFVSNSRLQSIFYSAADFFMMPSFQEAFAQTPMEAMACGTPVVAFPCSGSHDLINENNGVVCDDFTVDSLVKGIEVAMRKTYDGARIRESLLSRFSYDIIAQQYIKLYRSILSETH